MTDIRVGIDIGGTFTDIVFLTPDGTVWMHKTLSTPDDYSRAIRDGIQTLLQETDYVAADVREVLHGTTVATNAILEGKGAKTGLVTTKGFRDVLEIRRMRSNRLYDITWQKPKPLVPRAWRREVTERLDYHGEVLTPLDLDEARQEIARLVAAGVEAVAVCFLHAYANPAHEQRVGELFHKHAPHIALSLSSQVLPEMKEYERTSTTVINAYVQPVVQRYVQAMQSHLDALGVEAPLLIMQSNGGLMPADAAREAPMHIIESGPAAGVMGALTLGRQMGLGNIITLDIGGTTAKTSLIEHGELTRSPEYEVGGGMSMGHRLLKGGGYLLRVPSVDIAEVGAGGGSLAWVDRGGSLHVGPQSAGASPGPACYDLGGESATLTDANVVLGYLNPEALAGGRLRLNPSLAEQVIAEQVARPLDVEVVDAAWAVHRLADATMVRALRTVSTERGRDPRLFTLFAFGGKGPAHAIGIAQALQISRVVIPPVPGLFSSLALLFSEVEHHFSQTFFHTAAELHPDELQPVLARLQHQAQEQLQTDGYTTAQSHLSYFADMRYAGQNSELTIPLQAEHLTTVQALAQLQEAFAQEHERMYGYRSDGEPVQLMGLRVVARGLADATRVPELLRIADTMLPSDAGQTASRRAYFGPQHGWIDTPVMSRQALGQAPIAGPIIVEEYDATTVVPPGCRATLDRWSNIHVVVDLS